MILFLVSLIVILVLFWAARRILAVVPVEEWVKTVVYVVLVVVVMFWFIQLLFGYVPGWPVARWR